MHKLLLSHWQAIKRLLQYLKLTVHFGLQITKKNQPSLLQAFYDADWAGYRDDRHSTGGYCVFLDANLISWSCRKEATIARSSAGIVYKALGNTTTETSWLKSLLTELGIPITKSPVLCHNIRATYLSCNPSFHAHTKYVEIEFHFSRDMMVNKSLDIRFLSSQDQIADIFTKPLYSFRFSILRD